MTHYSARLVYPKQEFRIVLQSSIRSNEYFGVDDLERKKLKIILAKYGCRHCYHNIPKQVTLDLNKFTWNSNKACFEIDRNTKVSVQLNTLEECIVDYMPQTYYQVD